MAESLRAFPWRLSLAGLAVFGLCYASVRYAEFRFASPAHASGWFLFATVCLLMAFYVRKALPFRWLGTARFWMHLHLVAGVLSLALFALHAGFAWPYGGFERILLFFFLMAGGSGIIGWGLSRWLPRRLRREGLEPIFEELPSLTLALAEQVDQKVTQATGLGSLYTAEVRAWFRNVHYLPNRGSESVRLFSEQDPELLQALNDKRRLDRHACLQGTLKLWLFVHIPFSVLLILGSALHVGLVLSFSGGGGQ